MSLCDPVAIYNTANNVEAHLVRHALIANGIEAFVTEDVSTVGVWMLGLLPEIHKPQVWIDRENMLQASPILEEYERRERERRHADAAKLANEPPIQATCDECGKMSSFPSAQLGSIQDCPFCGEHMDVGDDDAFSDWGWQANDQPGD